MLVGGKARYMAALPGAPVWPRCGHMQGRHQTRCDWQAGNLGGPPPGGGRMGTVDRVSGQAFVCLLLILNLFGCTGSSWRHTRSFVFSVYLVLVPLGLRCCEQPFSSCPEWGLLFVALRELPIAVAPLVAAHRFSSCAWAKLLHDVGSSRTGDRTRVPCTGRRVPDGGPDAGPLIRARTHPLALDAESLSRCSSREVEGQALWSAQVWLDTPRAVSEESGSVELLLL